ncbi:MAG: hypothetical protein KH354_05055 [Clostridiales bacterium]|nr:hypothetical protein [Clostridiales bacterium]
MKKVIVAALIIAVISLMGIAAFAAETVITGFDASDIDAFMQQVDLSSFNVPVSALSKVSRGVKVECPEGAYAQNFRIIDSETLTAFKAFISGSNEYLRIYVDNQAPNAIGLYVAPYDADGKAIFFDCRKAVLIGTDGSKPKIETGDGGGAGANTSLMIPSGFKGYAVFALADLNLQDSGFDASKTLHHLEIDVRNAQGGSYILGKLMAVDSASAPAEDPSSTADVSTLAYAASAVLACGALMLQKKK